MKRKKRWPKWVVLTLAVLLIGYTAAVLIISYEQNQTIVLTEYQIENSKIPASFDGRRIVQLSDLHAKDWGDQLVEKVIEAAPDIIVITGDWIDCYHDNIAPAQAYLPRLAAVAPIYYVAGNHEAYSKRARDLYDTLQSAGVTVLENKAVPWTIGAESVNLIGIFDPEFSTHIFRDLPPLVKEEQYNILLYHRPEKISECAQYGADLVIAGHAHGGQICFPLFGALYAPNQGLFPTYVKGVYHEGQMDEVVSVGLGESGSFPLRLLDPPEIVTIVLKTES
ncbi:MAG: metallophosphoesterase [Clostridia bacterium]|nr:metallophosphoesterase [Clostridia bacterium]